MSDSNIVIIDYGMGNVGSIQNMLKHVGFSSIISSKENDITSAKKLIIAGVGAFDAGITNFKPLLPLVERKVLKEETPILGICLGMQLFSESSEEGVLPGFGWIKCQTVRFRFDSDTKLRVPHMGWNTVNISKKESKLLSGLPTDSRFYFVHSFYYHNVPEQDVLATTTHGIDFVSAVEKENIYGVQFHPEKSHKFGMKLLQNFAELT
jgi:glutamine amidotransferase